MSHGWRSNEYAALAALLRERVGLTFSEMRKASTETAMDAAIRKAGSQGISDYLVRLRDNAELLHDLIAQVTVGETYFFRDPALFRSLSTTLPELLARRSPGHVLRLWSAGCATGEEAYSLAFVCDELGIGARSEVFGTDISQPALAHARQGRYARWSLRGGEEHRLAAWFERHDGRFVVCDRIRQRVRFEYLNLADTAYTLPMAHDADIVLCRNVLIYFDHETAQRVGRRLLDCLAVGGWLLTGPSDPAIAVDSGFQCKATESGMAYRREASLAGDPVTAAAIRRLPERTPVSRPRAEAATVPAVAEPAAPPPYDDPNGQTLEARILALIDAGRPDAEALAADAAQRFPASPTLHFLHALALIEAGRHLDALVALRRTLYLDPSVATAYLALASVHSQLGDVARARAAYHAAHRRLVREDRDREVPLAGGARAGDLASMVRAQLARLDTAAAESPR